MSRGPSSTHWLPVALGLGLAATLPRCSPVAAATAPASPPATPTSSPVEDTTQDILDRLRDPQTVGTTVLDLVTEYQALRNDGEDLESFVAKYLEALTSVYASHAQELRPEVRRRLIQLLAGTLDPRTEPALRVALDGFASGRLPEAESDVESAARAQEELRLPELRAPLFGAFRALHAHSQQGQQAYRSVSDALLAAPDPTWADALREMVATPMPWPDDAPGAYADELFWQTVAARLLGVIGDNTAARPLLRVVLDPAKSEIGRTAVLALVKLGPAAVAPASAVLRGDDRELIAFHREQMARLGQLQSATAPTSRRDDHLLLAAVVLGASGQSAATDAFRHALRMGPSPTDRAVLLRELAKLPASDVTKTSFRSGFALLNLEVRMPPGGVGALAELAAEAVPRFYDPAMVPWLLARAQQTFGDAVARSDFRRAALATAIKLGQLDQLPTIEPKIASWGTPLDPKHADSTGHPRVETALFETARTLLERCQSATDCYLDAVVDPGLQATETRFAAIRAAYQLGIHGDAGTADQLAARLTNIESPAVRFAAVQAIDHLLPEGSMAVAKQLEAAASPHESGDPMREVAYRLRGRTQRAVDQPPVVPSRRPGTPG